MPNIILQFLFQKSAVTDLILLCVCTVSGVFSALIPRTQDKMLGKIYGKKKSLRVYIKDMLSVLWFISSILFLFRAVIVGIGSFSFLAIFLYILVFFLNFSIVFILNSLVEKRWHGLHKTDIDEILNNSPLYRKCIEECNNNFHKVIYILKNKIIISDEQVLKENLNHPTEALLTFPVESNKEARCKAETMAEEWKKQIIDNLSTIQGVDIDFSTYGYDLISDESINQLSAALSDKFALTSDKITKTFCVKYTDPSFTSFSVKGDTLSATTIGGKTYEARVTVTAATVLYKPIQQQKTEKQPLLTKW